MKFTVKKYLQISLFWIGMAAIMGLLIVFCNLALDGASAQLLTMVCAVVGIVELISGVYNLSNFFTYKKKCEEYTPAEGIIYNWSMGMPRGFGMLIVKVDDQEYTTGSYFYYWDCPNMVGKRVKYAIIDDVVILYEILEEN